MFATCRKPDTMIQRVPNCRRHTSASRNVGEHSHNHPATPPNRQDPSGKEKKNGSCRHYPRTELPPAALYRWDHRAHPGVWQPPVTQCPARIRGAGGPKERLMLRIHRDRRTCPPLHQAISQPSEEEANHRCSPSSCHKTMLCSNGLCLIHVSQI